MRRWWRVKVQQRVYRRLARRARRVHGRGPLLVAIGDSNTDPRCAYTLPRQVWLRIVGREGYRTVNLGVSGDTTADMRRRIEQTLSEGQPEIVVVFGGANDARRRVDPAETEHNVTFMVEWLLDHGVRRIVLIRLAIHLAPLNVVPCRGKVSGGLTSREQGRVGVRVGGERSLDQTVEEQAAVA